MTEREQLILILKQPIYPHELVDPAEAVADYLLDNGIAIPIRCRNCKWWNRRSQTKGTCRRYQTIKNENGYCDRGVWKYNA